MRARLWVALLLPITAAYAADPPQLKEGLWSVHTVTTMHPKNKVSDSTIKLCRDHAYDLRTEGSVVTATACTVVSDTFAAGKRVKETRCHIGQNTIVTKATTTTPSAMSQRTESETTYTPAIGGVAGASTVIDQKYIGSCPAGVQPGDRIGPDGKVIRASH